MSTLVLAARRTTGTLTQAARATTATLTTAFTTNPVGRVFNSRFSDRFKKTP